MGWRDLVEADDERIVLPWAGGRSLRSDSRTFKIKGNLPRFHGWYSFRIKGTKASQPKEAEPTPEILRNTVLGYLVGDRIIFDDARVDTDPLKIISNSERVNLLPEELDQFSRVRAGRVCPEESLIFIEQTFPFGPEDEVMDAFMDNGGNFNRAMAQIKGVRPALEAAFRMEVYQREQAEARRQKIARLQAEEDARTAQEARRQEMQETLGDGAGRRAMAVTNFTEAARAALAIGGAELLAVRTTGRGEKVVKYRFSGRRYECICDTRMRIIDSGICLQDHNTGEKGDTYFTLESLPAVIRQADREGKLVVYRHV